MIIKRKFDFLSTLEDIAVTANKNFPNQKGVGMEVVYRPDSKLPIRAEVFFGWDDCDYLHATFTRDEKIINEDDPREHFSEVLLRDRLIFEIDQLLKERIPNTKEKLEYIKSELEGLTNLKSKVFSKKDPEDVTIRLGNISNKQRLGDLDEKALKNIEAWNHPTKTQKKNINKNKMRVIIPSSALGGLIGYSKNNLKGGVKGALIGAGVGLGITIAGDKTHKRHANAAKKVLENRKNNK